MTMKKEYRVNAKGSYQGVYVLAFSPKEAKEIVRPRYPNEKLEVHLWKTIIRVKKYYYPSKLSSYAKKKMGVVS